VAIVSADAASRSLHELIRRQPAQPGEIAELFNGLSLTDTVAAARSLSGRGLQRPLWKAVEGNPRLSVVDLVPADYAPLRPVVFHGKNSLPAFTEFEKICCRPRNGHDPRVLWGYNETPIKTLVGPGYYVVRDTSDARLGGAAFDYREVPPERLPEWPEIRPNSAGLSRFVYNRTVDYMRRVSECVFIGAATREGREMDSYFVLVRDLR
jgi:hypothetical protein